MKRKNMTRNALVTSILALLLCVSMLVGTTFAWFTDEVTSGRNQIVSGNLDVVLEYKNNWNDDWQVVDSETAIFNEDALYEPGYTEVVFLRVSNAGNLALKYNLTVGIYEEAPSTNVAGEEFWLSDHLQVGTYIQDEYSSGFNYADILIPAMFGSREAALGSVTLGKLADYEDSLALANSSPLLPGEETAQVVALVLTMPETVGNEANHMTGVAAPWVALGVNLVATQYTHEEDSFDNQYDANVEKPTVHEIWNNDDLHKAFTEGGQGIIKNMNLTDVHEELVEDKSLALNTNNSTISGNGTDYVFVNYGDLEVTGDGTIVNNMKGSIENWGKLYVNNLNIDVKGDKYGFHVKAGEAELNDLVLNAERGGVNIQGGKVTINSGSYKFSGYYDDVNKRWINGQSVYAVGEDVEVVINGGDFRFTGGTGGNQRILVAQNGAKIIVNGGTFGKGNSKAAATWLWEYGGDIIIYGGSFEFDPTACVAEGYQAVKGADGWWTVSALNAG